MEITTKRISTSRANVRCLLLIPVLFGVVLWAVALRSAGATPATGGHPTAGCTPTWAQVPSQDPGSFSNNLSGVAAISANDVWMVGYYQGNTNNDTLIEHWNGTSISIVSSPDPGNGTPTLANADGVSTNDVWAVGSYVDGSNTTTLIEHWNGSAWSIVSSPNPTSVSTLSGVSAFSATNAWAVGYSRDTNGTNHTMTMHWNGSAWSIVASPNPGTAGNILLGVTATSANDVWAVGNQSSGGSAQTLTIHWNGSAWTTVASPNLGQSDNFLVSVSASGPNDAWAVGYYNTGGFNSNNLAFHWNGSTWAQGYIGDLSSVNILTGVVVIAPDDVWVAGNYVDTFSFHSNTVVQHFDGASWTISVTPNPGVNNNVLVRIAAVDSYNVWAVGRYSVGSTPHTLVERYSSSCPPPTATPAPPTATPTPCAVGHFSDVPSGSTFYPFVTCLVNHEIIGGYSDCTFRPQNNVTRGQLSKIVSNAAGFSDTPTGQQFEDVAVGSTFYDFVWRLASRSIVSGYACGGTGEPCGSGNKPYFRPNNAVSRGQTSKIVAIAKALPAPTPGQQTFQDVATNSTFWQWIEELSTAGAINGYACGGTGEPCGSGNKPYFRPANIVTRGQASKIVANTFYPNCQSDK